MAYTSGTREVGEDGAVALCPVPPDGVRIRNLGPVRVFIGGPGVGADGDAAGFPVDSGGSETVPGTTPKDSPVVPAPPDDLAAPVLYARTAKGTGNAKVSFISVS